MSEKKSDYSHVMSPVPPDGTKCASIQSQLSADREVSENQPYVAILDIGKSQQMAAEAAIEKIMPSGGLDKFKVENDMFEPEEDKHFSFPCYACIHLSRKDDQFPCSKCDHNLNANSE